MAFLPAPILDQAPGAKHLKLHIFILLTCIYWVPSFPGRSQKLILNSKKSYAV
jgi:hypothetical protein